MEGGVIRSGGDYYVIEVALDLLHLCRLLIDIVAHGASGTAFSSPFRRLSIFRMMKVCRSNRLSAAILLYGGHLARAGREHRLACARDAALLLLFTE